MLHHAHNRSKSKLLRRFTALLVLSAFATFAGAESVYKWVDSEGKTHYGDKRPSSGTDRQQIELKKAPAANSSIASRNSRTQRLLQSFRQEREEKKAERNAAAEKKKERKALCAEAVKTQKIYKNSSYLYDHDDEGERVILTDEQQAQEMARAQAEVDKWCH